MSATRPPSGASDAPVVLLIADGDMGWCVANAFAQRFQNLVVIAEQPEAKGAIVKRRARLLGWVPALGQAAGGVLHKVVARLSRSRIAALRKAHGLDSHRPSTVQVHDLESINSEACRALLASLQPSVVAVYGTRIIRRATLASVGAPFVNYHAGINPKYRGQHPAYWALVANDAEHAGITIHVVDEGVDTGGVLVQAPVAFERGDNITTYQWRQMTVALPLFLDVIDDARKGQLVTKTVDLPSQQHFPPTLWAYLWYGVTRRVW